MFRPSMLVLVLLGGCSGLAGPHTPSSLKATIRSRDATKLAKAEAIVLLKRSEASLDVDFWKQIASDANRLPFERRWAILQLIQAIGATHPTFGDVAKVIRDSSWRKSIKLSKQATLQGWIPIAAVFGRQAILRLTIVAPTDSCTVWIALDREVDLVEVTWDSAILNSCRISDIAITCNDDLDQLIAHPVNGKMKNSH